MHIDFHTHANLSKKITVSLEGFKEKIQNAKTSGLDAVAITEHFNSTNIIELYEMLQNEFAYEEEYYLVEGVKVFCGLEVDVLENGHFLLIGAREDILTIARLLLPFHEEENFIPVKDLISLIEGFNLLKIGAHPLRESTPWVHHDTGVLKQFDAFDLNGKDLFTYGPEIEDRVRAFATNYEIPIVGGSDTHHYLQYGAIVNDFPECQTIDDLREAIRTGNYQTKVSSDLPEKVTAAKEIKKAIKQELEIR
ncbi:PHP domain-containing protein [Oceanobacillus sp. CAU 1775]